MRKYILRNSLEIISLKMKHKNQTISFFKFNTFFQNVWLPSIIEFLGLVSQKSIYENFKDN